MVFPRIKDMPLKHVLRRLMRAPMFTVVTAVTLAVGIGANSAIFSVIEGVLLNPLPYPNPDSLIAVNHSAPGINFPKAAIAGSCTSPIGTKAGHFRTLRYGKTTRPR